MLNSFFLSITKLDHLEELHDRTIYQVHMWGEPTRSQLPLMAEVSVSVER